jgi:hypothetical protein
MRGRITHAMAEFSQASRAIMGRAAFENGKMAARKTFIPAI